MKRFIVIEGPDHIGKSSLIGKLIETGKVYSYFNFPQKTGSPLADLMKKMLLDPSIHNTSPLFKSLLFSVDRLRAKEELVSGLASSSHPQFPFIISDRYTYSNIAYQIGLSVLDRTPVGEFGDKNISDLKEISNEVGNLIQYVEFGIMNLPKPDLVVCLTAGNSDYFSLNRPKREEDDLNDSSVDLQKFINRFFRSDFSSVKSFNLNYWYDRELVVVDVLKKNSVEFREKDDILNQVLREMMIRGML
jgi:hypothetical protein